MHDRLAYQLQVLESLACEQGATLYAILRRNAGWAFQWYEESRCTTPSPDEEPRGLDAAPLGTIAARVLELQQIEAKRLQEGLVVYNYWRTLGDAVEAELSRLTHLRGPRTDDRDLLIPRGSGPKPIV